MNPIRRLRHEAGLTQHALAGMAGTSQATIAAYETGTKSPTWQTITRIAAAVGLEPVITFTPTMTHAEYRSLCFHLAVAEALKQDPETVLQRARQHLRRLASMHPHARGLLDRWREWLDEPVDELIAKITDPGTLAREMRHVSPLAGVLSPGRRAEVLKRVRRERAA